MRIDHRLLAVMDACHQRWSSIAEVPIRKSGKNIAGDLWELVLARCYLADDGLLNQSTQNISNAVFWVHDIVHFIIQHGAHMCSPHATRPCYETFEPQALAKGLLYARNMYAPPGSHTVSAFEAWARFAKLYYV